MAVLKLYGISKSYQEGANTVNALQQADLEVQAGELIAIIGPSGSGKSTFLSISGALLSSTTGDVIIGETNLTEKSKKELETIRRNQIGFVFQSHQLIPYLTVLEQLKLIPVLSGKKPKENEAYAKKLLEDFGLSHRFNYYPDKLSGGEKQRVAIARALMNRPDIILADEPTASLDGTRGREVVETIRNEIKKYNKAALMVTHDERVLDLVDTIYRIEGGNLTLEKRN